MTARSSSLAGMRRHGAAGIRREIPQALIDLIGTAAQIVLDDPETKAGRALRTPLAALDPDTFRKSRRRTGGAA